jgi:predicted benzoate:H+ symporter BenE
MSKNFLKLNAEEKKRVCNHRVQTTLLIIQPDLVHSLQRFHEKYPLTMLFVFIAQILLKINIDHITDFNERVTLYLINICKYMHICDTSHNFYIAQIPFVDPLWG